MRNDRSLPHDNVAEESVLGGALLEADAMADVADSLTPDDFYRPIHQRIYAAMLRLHERREPMDVVTLGTELREAAELADVGGMTYLAELLTRVPTAANIRAYIRIVRDRAVQRALIVAATKTADAAYLIPDDVGTLVTDAEQRLETVAGLLRASEPASTASDSVQQAIAHLDQPQGKTHRIPTGFPTLDDHLGGFLRGTLVVIGARPGGGKSILASALAVRGACAQGIGVLHRSLEMRREELVLRAFADACSIPNWRLQRAVLDDRDAAPVARASAAIAALPWFIRDVAADWREDLRAYDRMLRQHPEIGMLIVDHVGLVRGVGGGVESRHLVIGEITSTLAELARRRNIVVVLCSQLNRGSEKDMREPILSDLRESGSLEQDASVVLFLNPTDKDAPGHAPQDLDLIIAKNRQGRIGKYHFRLHKQFCRILDPADEDVPTILREPDDQREWHA